MAEDKNIWWKGYEDESVEFANSADKKTQKNIDTNK